MEILALGELTAQPIIISFRVEPPYPVQIVSKNFNKFEKKHCDVPTQKATMSSALRRIPLRSINNSAMDVEVVDDDEFDQLEALCKAAEQRQSSVTKPRALPASFTAPTQPPLPYLRFGLAGQQLQYCCDAPSIERAAQLLLAMRPQVVGFDIEWTVTYQAGVPPRPISLFQMCFQDVSRCTGGLPSQTCALLHVAACGMTPSLVALLRQPSILKCGIGISNDALKVHRDFAVEIAGVLDLGEFARSRVGGGEVSGSLKWSLASLTERLLRRRLRKTQSLRCGDWEQVPLTAEQLEYAATDAWASLAVYEELSKMAVIQQPNPIQPAPMATVLQPTEMEMEAVRGEGAQPAWVDGIVPPCEKLAPLQPAKKAVHDMHLAGVSVQDIAALRQVQYTTVQSYIAEAIAGGYGYRWRDVGVTYTTLRTAAEIANGLLKTSLRVDPQVETTLAPRDLTAELLQCADGSWRQLREELFRGALDFGEIRLALAHLGRSNPAFVDL